MKFLFLLILLFGCDNFHEAKPVIISSKEFKETESIRLKLFAFQAKKFCAENRYSTSLFFLIDMTIHSGKKRFYIYDLKSGAVLFSSMVAHGACGYFFLQQAEFSNKPDCGCSSFGKYRIGNKYNGRFGVSYKLYGLDSSNSNAYRRSIVLHSYYAVPDYETYPDDICNSLGCPMVSPRFMKQLETTIDSSARPVLLWIIN